MTRDHWIIVVMSLCTAVTAAAGDVWIAREPGFEFFFDGETLGVAEPNAPDGRLPAVQPGEHTIKIERDGSVRAEYAITLGPAPTQIVFVDLSSGAAEGPLQEGQRPWGSIEITSNPKKCEVEFAGRRISKEQPVLMILGMEVGEHRLDLSSAESDLSATVMVDPDRPARVRVDFGSRFVAVVDAESDRDQSESAEKEASPRDEPECIEYWIQVMRTSNVDEIEPMQSALRDLGFPIQRQKVITIEAEGTLPVYKLRVGPIERSDKARWAAGLIKNAGVKSVWVLPEACGAPTPRPSREYRPVH